MKFRKIDSIPFLITVCATLVFILFTAILTLQQEKNMSEICIIIGVLVVTPLALIVMINYSHGSKFDRLYDEFKDGKKIQGYVVDTFTYHFHKSRNNSGRLYGIKVLANNKIYIVKWLENNESFWKLESKVKNIQFDNGIISIDKIPVDVYLKNDDYYVDIKNIKL